MEVFVFVFFNTEVVGKSQFVPNRSVFRKLVQSISFVGKINEAEILYLCTVPVVV